MVTPKRKKETEIEIDEGTPAKVVEKTLPSGSTTKTVEYQAVVKQNEVDNEDSNNNDFEEPETDFPDFSSEIEEVPKTQIERMFEELSIVSNGQSFTFFAMISRLPDSTLDDFYVRCNSDSPAPLGKFQFNNRDILNFDSAIQKLNNNSGGRFNVSVYDGQGAPVMYHYQVYGQRQRESYRVGIINLYIPNPIITDLQTTQNGNENNSMFTLMQQQMQQSEQRFERLLLEMKAQPQDNKFQDQMMGALIPAMIGRLLENPQAIQQNPSMLADVMKHEMFQIQLIKEMFREHTPEEKTTLQQILDFLQTDQGLTLGKGAVTAISNVPLLAAQVLGKGNNNNNQMPQIPLPNTQQTNVQQNDITTDTVNYTDEVEELSLMDEILIELEGENEITKENETIKSLKARFPVQIIVLQSICKVNDFSVAVNMLREQYPESFDGYVTITEQGMEYNEKGKHVITRLQTVYELMKEN